MTSATFDRRVAFAPAVIIGDHADQRVGKLGLAGELVFGLAVMPITSQPHWP